MRDHPQLPNQGSLLLGPVPPDNGSKGRDKDYEKILA